MSMSMPISICMPCIMGLMNPGLSPYWAVLEQTDLSFLAISRTTPPSWRCGMINTTSPATLVVQDGSMDKSNTGESGTATSEPLVKEPQTPSTSIHAGTVAWNPCAMPGTYSQSIVTTTSLASSASFINSARNATVSLLFK